MPEGRVIFDAVWKKFRRGERHDSLRDLIPATVRRIGRSRSGGDLQASEFWAIRDVSFMVGPGEALGIIGPNGAGKSTVLKLLTKIFKPSRGTCRIVGRAGALIELAAGFHPDLTGRENIYLQGAIMGMGRADIDRSFDRIVEFAGVPDFVDTPVKRYSSGMNARLGFSIAAHLNPDVLLIDEVLAVGDGAFQEKCFERMRSFRREGVAIVFVSHNLAAVRALCDRVLVLRNGETQTIAAPSTAFLRYADVLDSSSRSAKASDGAHEAFIEIVDEHDRRAEVFPAGEGVVLKATVSLARPVKALASGIRIRRLDTGEVLFFTTNAAAGDVSPSHDAHQSVEIRWAFRANFARGQYSIELVLFEARTEEILWRLSPAAHFAVTEGQSKEGVVYLDASCSTLTAKSVGTSCA